MESQNRPGAEVSITIDLVQSLLRRQHPDLADQPLRLVASGWDNEVLRLGDDLAVRMPRRAVAVPLIRNEMRWLPQLARGLPLSIPMPIRSGRPDGTYPWPWAITRWLPGRIAAQAPPDDSTAAATALGRFVSALCGPADPAAPANVYRGVPLAKRDDDVRRRLARWGPTSPLPTAAVMAAWDRALAAPAWVGPPMWLHGDLHPANLLVHRGRLSAVLDFGDLTAGDPATDLSVAWMHFDSADRDRFREAAGQVDDATWDRARGNALAHAIACLDHSADSPVMAVIGRRTVQAVLDDGDG